MEITYQNYLDAVYGGWLGKCIGGAIGAMQENNKGLLDYTIDNVFPAEIPPNDDLDLQVLWLQEVLEKKGTSFTSEDIARAFAEHNLELVNEYAVAIKNIELGILPPVSGVFNNPYFKNSMGCPIRSEIWGFSCPGEPEAAMRYVEMDGCIDHDTESIQGEKLLAAMESAAFFEQDIRRLLACGLSFVTAGSRLERCVRSVLGWYEAGLPWRETRGRLIREFGSADASYSVVNIGIIVMALLYGERDYSKTLMIAVNSGYDTDCTAATAGAILGQMLGAKRIPDFWKEKIGQTVVIGTVDIQRPSDSIEALARDTCGIALAFLRDGVLHTRITGVPPEAETKIPLPQKPDDLEIRVRYCGKPVIACEQPAEVELTLVNRTARDRVIQLELRTPAHLEAAIKAAERTVAAGREMTVPVSVQVRKDAALLPQNNRITAVCRDAVSGAVYEREFGLSGAYRMRLYGPFFDNYDTKTYDADPFCGKRQLLANGELDLFAMFNGYADIDRAYLDERFERIDAEEGRMVSFPEDKLALEEQIGYRGPACVYLVYDFVSPEEMKEAYVWVGNNDAYKIWLNGEAAACERRAQMWMPLNRCWPLHIRAGRNRMILKVCRHGAFEFSIGIGSREKKDHFLTELASVL